MKVLVVYDSVFGNTEQIARVVGESIRLQFQVEVLRVADVTPERLAEADLLLVGSPTRGFRPTEATMALLRRLRPKSLVRTKVAAFDTRFKADEMDSAGLRFLVRRGGYAAKRISSQLGKAGGREVVPPEGFYVDDVEGPLKEGELERAAAWAKTVAAAN